MDRDLGKLAAATIGVGICLVALGAWRLPTSGSPPGLDLRLIMTPPGELTVEPTGTIASARAMQAGDAPVGGVAEVHDIAGRRLVVRPVALPSSKSLASKVRLREEAGGRTIASGTLASLERPRGPGVRLLATGSRRIEIAAWIPAGTTGYRGSVLDVTLELRATVAGAKR